MDELNFILAGEDMEVHEFDMRFPPAQSDASEGEEDAPIRDRSALWDGGVIPYELGNSISKYPLMYPNVRGGTYGYTFMLRPVHTSDFLLRFFSF